MEDENDKHLDSEHRREIAMAMDLAAGFEDMPIASRLQFIGRTLAIEMATDSKPPWQVPMPLQVAYGVLCQVITIIDRHPSAANLSDATEVEIEAQRPQCPASGPTRSRRLGEPL